MYVHNTVHIYYVTGPIFLHEYNHELRTRNVVVIQLWERMTHVITDW